jgi:hypothetical protein
VNPILGYAVVREHMESPFGPGQRLIADRWRAPHLNCLLLREIKRVVSDTGSPLGTNSLEAETVVVGEPSQQLFEIPEHVRETLPSMALKAINDLTGEEFPECLRSTGNHADQLYLRHQVN